MPEQLSHTDEAGRARMVDVSAKLDTQRTAVAAGCVRMRAETAALIRENAIGKGDVLAVARIAGIMAAKQTASLIPMCHPLMLTDVLVEMETREDRVEITAIVRTTGKTGVEMEALVAVSTAALTVYDMCKAVDRGMVIEGIRVTTKTGGKSDWSSPSDVSDPSDASDLTNDG